MLYPDSISKKRSNDQLGTVQADLRNTSQRTLSRSSSALGDSRAASLAAHATEQIAGQLAREESVGHAVPAAFGASSLRLPIPNYPNTLALLSSALQRRIVSFLRLSDAVNLALSNPNGPLSNPELKSDVSFTFSPSENTLEQMIAQPQEWARRIPNLTHLKLPIGTTDAQLQSLVTSGLLNSVTDLDLSGCWGITDVGLISIDQLTNLISLSLRACTDISDAGLAFLAKLINLRNLDLSGCRFITGAIMNHIGQLTNLSQLYVNRCGRIAFDDLEKMRTELPNLVIKR